MTGGAAPPETAGRRLDQWLWFARLVKTRSLAARLCATRTIIVNGAAVKKARYRVRIGDAVTTPQGGFRRTLRVLGLGTRRGPVAEARALYHEIAAPVPLSEFAPSWSPLLAADPDGEQYDDHPD